MEYKILNKVDYPIDLKKLDNPGTFRPIFKIAFDSIAAVKLEYIFSYILGTDINKCG